MYLACTCVFVCVFVYTFISFSCSSFPFPKYKFHDCVPVLTRWLWHLHKKKYKPSLHFFLFHFPPQLLHPRSFWMAGRPLNYWGCEDFFCHEVNIICDRLNRFITKNVQTVGYPISTECQAGPCSDSSVDSESNRKWEATRSTMRERKENFYRIANNQQAEIVSLFLPTT